MGFPALLEVKAYPDKSPLEVREFSCAVYIIMPSSYLVVSALIKVALMILLPWVL